MNKWFHKFKRYGLHTVALLLVVHAGLTQEMTTELNKSQIALGEQVSLQLKISHIPNNFKVKNWFSIPDTGNHVEVIERKKIDTNVQGNTYQLNQEIIITSFDSGRWALPLAPAMLINEAGARFLQTADSVYISVNSVDVSKMQDFHDIKDVIEVAYTSYTWLYYVGGLLLLIFLVWVILKWLRKRNKKTTVKSVIKGPPLQWALQEIDKLVKENLIGQHQELQYFDRLDDICKTYYDEKVNANTYYLTAREIFDKLQRFLQNEKERASFYELNKMNDAVKFARYQPSQMQADKAATIATDTLKTIEAEMDVQKQNNNQTQNIRK